ncbi:hypothetical protein QC334_25970 [Streptomyces sp. DH18]|nr:hypothetical protein [Streptomyces sp. DH18]MDG9686139.1 hypothetical protein [Streptomyces sp. DH18]
MRVVDDLLGQEQHLLLRQPAARWVYGDGGAGCLLRHQQSQAA